MSLFDYRKLRQYIDLPEQDKQLFDFFYPILKHQGCITASNEELLNSFGNSFSFKSDRALREHLNVLIKAGLIERDIEVTQRHGHPLKIRHLYLNRLNFPDCFKGPKEIRR